MRYTFQVILLGTLLISAFFMGSCKKKDGFSTGNLSFSKDTVVFDTVFTTIGSTTQRLKLYNKSNGTINIDEIQLLGGSSSPFRINVDGLKGTDFADLEVEKGDSLFVFVEVTLGVNNGVLPLVVEDRIRFRTNGKDQFVQLAVWGQDAYFWNNDVVSGTWPNDKPHVIYGFAGIDSATTLNIQKGTQIFLHKNSMLLNFKGTLNMNGTKDEKIVLQGDRLEQYYQEQSGQFYGIYFQEARPSVIEHVEIRNGTAGIHVFSKDPNFGAQPTLTLRNSEIYNNSNYGVFLYAGGKIKAENCLIYKNGIYALFVLEGGDFDFNHCNLLGYGSSSQEPAVGISNRYRPDILTPYTIGDINEGKLTNCVITGNQLTELVIDAYNPNGTAVLNFNIANCLIAMEEVSTETYFSDIVWNGIPGFMSLNDNDYRYYSTSPLEKAGVTTPTLIDFEESPRDTFQPDIGAWEMNY